MDLGYLANTCLFSFNSLIVTSLQEAPQTYAERLQQVSLARMSDLSESQLKVILSPLFDKSGFI